MAPATMEVNTSSRPTIDDLTGDNYYAELARSHWLGKKKAPKVQNSVVKEELWDNLEKEGFAHGSLLLLEQLQLLERYLWPGYSDDASNYHVILLVFLVNTKRREGLPLWGEFSKDAAAFSSFFRRVLHLTIDSSISIAIRTHLIAFLVGAFQSLDSGIIRKECAPLVSIGIWHNLHSESARQQLLEKTVQLGKAWRAASKRYDGADAETQARLRFERSWLYSLVLDFLNRLYDDKAENRRDTILYCERVVELLADLQSQLPTRRYVNTLLQDLHILPAIALSPAYAEDENGLLRDLCAILRHYTYFPIEDHSGREYTQLEYDERHHSALSRLQNCSLKHFRDKLKILILSNYASLDSRDELEGHLTVLSDDEVKQLCGLLGMRTEYSESSLVTQDRAFYLELLLSIHERRPRYQETVRGLAVLPTEKALYEQSFLRTETYDGFRPLAIPKLNLQYLTMGDFLWRSFILYRCESFYAIRKHVEDTVKRIQPKQTGSTVRFNGYSRMAIPISKPAVIEVSAAKVGESHAARVEVEVSIDVGSLVPGQKKEWETMRQDDVVFLVAAQSVEQSTTNGHTGSELAEMHGVKHLRSATVIRVMDEDGRIMRDVPQANGERQNSRGRKRKILLNLDPAAYSEDKKKADSGKGDIYDDVNLLVRRKGRENNFKPILDSIKHLTLSDVPAPSWLQEVFLGYSDPAAATYQRLPNKLKAIDFRDTFLDWSHLIESLPGKTVEPDASMDGSFPPPYVLETMAAEEPVERPLKKRRRGQDEAPPAPATQIVKVKTYDRPNTGPYPTDAPKTNSVRFTPAQIEAINSGSQPGLTVVVGPPGTGKTDVATQIINNIYHNFPTQRTLLVAHSNQALNQLFQKIMALDIDERHLLRLGHGEEELDTTTSYSKHGRVESLLENAGRHLYEVSRLAASIGAPGSHGDSCETAQYFDQVYVKPAWTKYWDTVKSGADSTTVIEAFPFHDYFATAPQPIFPQGAALEQLVDIASGCERHMNHIFDSLSDTRPFEILRSARDKANYLLIKEARIIAMTSTHAAMRRQEIADLGFRYDNVIMEEAAQITEIENFIPIALQNPRDGEMKLQRIVLVGDHLQNSPIVQNLAFRQYANLEQSLFLRLVRLGVPTILLDQQGRARPSLASLYQWRYPHLSNLPLVSSAPEFIQANAGFRYDHQFIDVPDYKDKGESEPTPHFIQNLGEAEYAVAMYQYMRLLGYPADKITIMATYAGQCALINDVLGHRCKSNRLFGLPAKVSTVDKYQGEQNDYIILSLTRTSRPGYLRDLRRLTVALSRARLGLYVLGRRSVFEACFELQPAFEKLFARPDKLTLVTGEMFPTDRRVDDDNIDGEEGKVVQMEGVEHLGQYVFEMTKAKVEDMKQGLAALPPAASVKEDESADEDEGPVVEEVDEV